MSHLIAKAQNFSQNPHREGRVLVLSLGGAGIPNHDEKDLHGNLRTALELTPYLSDIAGLIDYLGLAQKDSADLSTTEVACVAETIYRYQNSYDGFVVIAGTDTMPYVSAATAFALRGMGVPIIFIGAGSNVEEWDTDFRLNLPNAVKVASMGALDVNAPSFGEVGILFDDSLLRAVATINRGLRSNNPMISPRVPKLGDVGWTIKFETMTKPRRPSQLNYSRNVNTNIAYFDLVSPTHLSAFRQLVEDQTIHGIVIGAFGAGNVPTGMIPLMHRAVYEHGKAIAVITNNKKGSSDMGLYSVGAAAVRAGAISLGPMTKAAAIEKTRYAVNNAKGQDAAERLQDAARLLLTSVAAEIPEDFSRHAVNLIRSRFGTLAKVDAPPHDSQKLVFNEEVKTYCRSQKAPYRILTISMGGTFYMEVDIAGSLRPTKRPLSDLLNQKFKGLETLVSLDYIELMNLDSTDIEYRHRAILAKTIAKHLKSYDGIIVLHGTDTMAYTAACLSYMLLGIEKDVILTGSQKPGYGSSDFDRNFVKAIKSILARLDQPEKSRIQAGVKIAFGDKLMIGTTVIKEDEHGINAFAPVEKHPVAGGLSNRIELHNITQHVKKRPFGLFTGFDCGVAYFECVNGIEAKQFENLIENPDVSGVLIGGYDDGNMPLQMKYYISTAVNSYSKPVAFIANSDNGIADVTLSGRTGQFVKAGAIALGDMIKESAFQKMCFAMGVAARQKDLKGRDRLEFVRKIMHTNLAAEISDRFCAAGDRVYRGLFTDRIFSDEDIQKALLAVKEAPSLAPFLSKKGALSAAALLSETQKTPQRAKRKDKK